MGNDDKFSCYIIGDGALLIACGELIIDSGHDIYGVISSNPLIREWAEDKGIKCIDPSSDYSEFLRQKSFDYLFSIVYLNLIPKELLTLPKKMAINFHDALLPKYAGIHATSWAIMNKETKHGITWHEMVSEVDKGNILKQKTVKIGDNETAFSLNVKCYEAGLQSFTELLDELANDRYVLTFQDLNRRTYYGKYKRPPAGCVLSWKSSAEEMDAMVRALNFGKYQNKLGFAKIAVCGEYIIVGNLCITERKSGQIPGAIVQFTDSVLRVATVSNDIEINSIMTIDGIPLPVSEFIKKYKLKSGDCLVEMDHETGARVTLVHSEISRFEDYWVDKLLQLRSSNCPGLLQTEEGKYSSSYSTVEIAIAQEFLDCTKKHNGHEFAYYLAAIGGFFFRECGTSFYAAIGYGELKEELKGLENLFAVHVPIRLDLNGSHSFNDICDIASKELKSIKKHKTYLRDLVVRSPQLHSRSAFGLGNELPITVEYVKDLNDSQTNLSRGEVSLVIPENGNIWNMIFREDALARDKALLYSKRLATFLKRIAVMPKVVLGQITTLADDEIRTLVYERNNTAIDYPKDKCIHELIKERVKQYPKKIAAIYKDENLTYMELEEKASLLASFLNRSGVRRGSLVGIFIERSLDMLVGLLGVLKAGGTYVPIDPIYPSERILHMIEDADIKMVLTQEKIEHKLPQSNAKIVCLDKAWEEICTDSDKSSSRKYYSYANKNIMPEDSAYVIFTSGSTGKPKGVEITHKGLTNFLCSMEKCPGFTKEDQILALTTICFDIAGLELYLPLITGGQVEILPTEIARDGFQLKERIENGTATVVQATPATWEMLLEAGWNRKSPIKVLCGGEALSRELAKKLLDRSSEVWNVYGPTETTIWSSISRVNLDEEITIGRPIANTQFYILDEYLNPVPDGATGELCIGGDGVAKGYLNRLDLTKEKFVPNPFVTDGQSKIYKTGDSAKYSSGGRVVCLGRIDNQVKLRGFRIELGEIESVLEKQHQIKRAVVVVKEDDTGYKKLVAFVVPERSMTPLTGKKLSEAVREFLPDYMIPASYIYLDILPLTLNLKVDRKILTLMNISQIIENYGYKEINHDVEIHKQGNTMKKGNIDCKEEDKAFAGYFEKDLVEIVAGVVKTPKEEIDFGVPMGEYGYDSIRFTVLSKRIKDKYDITITPAQFYTYTTIHKLKEHMLFAFKEQLERYYGKDVKSVYNEQPPNIVSLAITSAAALEANEFTGHPDLERDLVEIVAGVVKIPKEEIDFGVSMGEYGYDSIRFTVLSKRIKDKYDITITPAQFYTYTTINKLTDFLWSAYRKELKRYYVEVSPEIKHTSNSGTEMLKERESSSSAVFTPSVEFDSNQNQWKREPVAIIGISGIFPQSPDLDTFWDHIVNKRDLITEIPLERWNSNNYYVKRTEENKISHSRWGGFLEDIDKFDAAFFNISPREAEQMDPQQRIFLETVWKAIENAGYKASEFSGTNTGVYVGAVSSDYWDMMLCSCLEADSYTISGNINCVIANRVSYLLNLQGASASIDTACSSSLVAIHRAVTALQNGYCDMAIAGGVNIILNPFMHIALSTNGMLSVDGRCKTFDSQANGYVRGEGAGALILKPLSKAIADGDNIHAVIKGSFENHGGRTNSLTAPNPNAQADLLIRAYSEAGVDPSTVTYIEAHGTGTSLGDPIEINGLKMAFEELCNKWGMSSAENYCGLGSVKTNIGHLEAGAGIAGLLKIVLAMQKGILPGMIHFKEQNPYIDLEGSPFYIVSETQEWDRLTDRTGKIVPRRAGVSSFGFGGSNSHIVLEEYCNPRSSSTVNYHSPNIFVLSAKNEDRLKAYAMDMLTYLEKLLMRKEKGERVEDAFSDIMYTLQMGREIMNKRLAIVASDMEELIQKLRKYCAGKKEITQLYIGPIGFETKNIITLLEGNCGKEFIETIIRQKDHKKLAHLWVSGISLDWNLLYDNPLPRRISLPTYPFARERHWIFKSDNKFTSRSIVKVTTSHIHPLLQQNTSDFFEQRFSSTFSGQEFFLKDYVVTGQRVLTGFAHLEMAHAAVVSAAGGKEKEQNGIKIKNVTWNRPVVVGEKAVQVNIRLLPEESGDIYYEIYSRSEMDDTASIVHSQGHAVLSPVAEVAVLDLKALQVQCNRNSITVSQCYEAYRIMGVDYGPGYQGVKEIHVGENQVLAKVVLPSCISDTQSQFVMHPSIMDSALQASIGLIMSYEIEPLKPILPFTLREAEILRPCTSTMWVHVQYNDGSNLGEKIQELDVDLCDEQGVICVRIKGFCASVMGNDFDSKGVSIVGTMMLQPSWQIEDINPEVTIPDYTQQIVIFCEPDATLKEKIEADSKGIRYLILQSKQKYVDERFQAYAFQAFDEIKNLLKDKPRGNVLIQIVVSTQNEQQLFSALFGLLKTAQLENTKLIGQLIEVQLGETWESIVQKLKENSRCPMDKKIQYRDGKRWVAVWREIEDSQEVIRIPWKDQGIYLITGGTGGLGLIFSQEIVQQVKNPTIILTGRSSLSQEKQAKIKKLEELGARIEYRQVDVTDKKAVIELIQNTQQQFGRLHGIIHGAGVIRDNFILKKTKEELQEVLAPKVSGLVNLDEASKELSLDFFILFSSVSGSLGNIGQADYAMANDFMNAYAGYRNALVASKQRQGHTLAINWPLWKEGGMAVNEEIQKMMVRNMGMIAMSTSNGLRSFYQGLATGKDQVMVMEGVLVLLKERLLSKASCATLQPENISVTSNFTEVVYKSSLLEKMQSVLIEVVSKLLKVKIEDIDINTELNEYGFDSITYIEFANKLNQEYKFELTPTVFFEYSTIQSFAGYLVEEYGAQLASQFVVTTNVDERTSVNEPKENLVNKKMHSRFIRPLPLVLPKADTTAKEAIAIVGISGIFPMAKDVNELWDNLLEGKDCITEIPKYRWDWREYYGDPTKEINKTNIKWGGFIDGVEEFDPLFFGISPREAELMDPQQRLLMTYVWKVIEDAGYSAQSLSDTQTGIFVGTASCSGYSGLISQSKIAIGEYFSTGMLPSVGPNRMSYLLNFHGPSEPIETACSSSLVAIHRAVNAIENGACEMAIAGGVNTIVTPENHISLNKAGMLSEDGRCKAFSDQANGFVRSEGVGMLFLKKLKDAELAGDHIYGVIRGTAENHGGRANSLTAPNPKAQAQLLQTAYTKAGIDPRTVTYIEAHGTGTELGDPIEINGLKTAFKELYRATGDSHVTGSHCGLGSVKTNIGHLELSAGVAGVIKVLLQLKHKTLVKNLHCDKVNPYIQLIDSPFYIVQEQEEWKALQDAAGKDIPRRGGVSSFGFGGVNAHVVIEEYIPGNQERELIPISPQNPALIVLSAKNEERLKEQVQQLLGAIEEQRFVDSHLADMAYTLQVGREAMEERLAMIVGSMKELKERLKSFIEGQQHIEDLYWGQVKRNKETVAIFTADEDLEKIIDVWVAKRKYKKLLNLWVKGLSFDWNKLYDNVKPQRISLPTYPFARERYWIPNSESKGISSSTVPIATFIHPLLHQNISDFSEQRFISRFTGKEFFMDQNIVKGQRILPGMAYLEMARAAVVQSVGSLKEEQTGVRLKNVVWGSPVVIKEQGLQVHIALCPEDNGDVIYEIYSEAEKDAESQLYSQGTAALFSVTEFSPLDIEALRAECCQDLLTSNQIYERLTAVGINYGPEHKGIEKIYVGLGQILAKLTVPSVVNTQDQFVLHPILMDAVLQAAMGLITGFGDRKLYLPFALGEIEIICNPASTMWALIRYSDGNKAGKVPKLDIQLFDGLGKICVRMRRMEIQENTERKLLK